MMQIIEIIEGKFNKVFKRIIYLQEILVKTYLKELQKTDLNTFKIKSIHSPKLSQFFKYPSSPNSIKSGSGSLSPCFKAVQRKCDAPKMLMKLILRIKYLMMPIIMFLSFRDHSHELEKNKKLTILTERRTLKKKSTFCHQNVLLFLERSLFLKRYKFLKETPLFLEGNLIYFCQKQLKKWSDIKKNSDLHLELDALKKKLEHLEQKLLVCSICGKQITGKSLKEHSQLCQKSDELNIKLKSQLTLLKNYDLIWLDHHIRKSKNLIPIIKQQLKRLIQTTKSFANQFKIIATKKIIKLKNLSKTCPIYCNKNIHYKNNSIKGEMKNTLNKSCNNLIMISTYKDDHIVKNKVNISKSDVQETLRKFKSFRKNRELNENIKIRKTLETGRNLLKILFRLYNNITNYRSI